MIAQRKKKTLNTPTKRGRKECQRGVAHGTKTHIHTHTFASVFFGGRRGREGGSHVVVLSLSLTYAPRRGSGHSGGVALTYSLHPATPAMRLPWSSTLRAESVTRMEMRAATPPAPTTASRGWATSAGAPDRAVPTQKTASPSRLGCRQMR